jgi:hypothetical protein
MDAKQLVTQLQTGRQARLEKAWSAYPRNNPIASDLHDCDRYAVLAIAGWHLRPAPGFTGLELMENGNVMEAAGIRQLQDEGWKVVEAQTPFEERRKGRVILRGRIDGVLVAEDRSRYPFDYKDTSWFRFNQISTVEDLQRDQWTRKWWRQFQAYMLLGNYEMSVLILGHRGGRKYIVVELDYDAAEAILKQCELAAEVAPQLRDVGELVYDADLTQRGIDYCADKRTCEACPFYQRVCHPPHEVTLPTDVVVMPQLEDTVRRHQTLADSAAEYRRLDTLLKKEGRGRTILAGDWLLTGTFTTKHFKAQPAKEARDVEEWRSKIVKVTGGQ